MNFKKSFVIKFQRSELLEIEIKKMTQIQEERSKITFAFLDDFNRLDSLKGRTMRQKLEFCTASNTGCQKLGQKMCQKFSVIITNICVFFVFKTKRELKC